MRTVIRVTLVVLLASCGRAGFEPGGDARGSGTRDDAASDAVPDAKVCGPDYQPAAGLTSKYRVVTTAVTWYVAEQDCESDGGHLVVIDDDAENTWVESQVVGWLGLTDHETEGTFLHVTGAPPSYSNWNPSEPSDTGGNEDCVAHYFGIEWNDYACGTSQPYVCECDDVPLPSPPVWCVTGQNTSCNTCDDVCQGAATCSTSQTCVP